MIAATFVVAAIVGCAKKPAPRSYAATMKNFVIEPAVLTVSLGDTVVWTNTDFVPHSATAKDGSWDSKQIDANASFRYVATVSGRHDYYCVFHPNMTATLVVR
jgi:plastocyanin